MDVRWKRVRFPLPPGSRVGRAANKAYLPRENGARWAERGDDVVFAWASSGEAVVVIVHLVDDEVQHYALLSTPSLSDYVQQWKPNDADMKRWCRAVRDALHGEWDEHAANKLVEHYYEQR